MNNEIIRENLERLREDFIYNKNIKSICDIDAEVADRYRILLYLEAKSFGCKTVQEFIKYFKLNYELPMTEMTLIYVEYEWKNDPDRYLLEMKQEEEEPIKIAYPLIKKIKK